MDAAQRGLIVQYGCTLYSTLLNKDICSTCTVCTVGCSSKWINVSENIGMHRRIYCIHILYLNREDVRVAYCNVDVCTVRYINRDICTHIVQCTMYSI